jgi:hypothetical protein
MRCKKSDLNARFLVAYLVAGDSILPSSLAGSSQYHSDLDQQAVAIRLAARRATHLDDLPAEGAQECSA